MHTLPFQIRIDPLDLVAPSLAIAKIKISQSMKGRLKRCQPFSGGLRPWEFLAIKRHASIFVQHGHERFVKPTFTNGNVRTALAFKRKGIKRRIFLAGSALLVGGGVFGLYWADNAAKSRARALTTGEGEHNFLSWMKIAEDDTVTLYSPHIDFGQGTHTALGQMLADELDAAWDGVKIEQAPADMAFAHAALAKGFLPTMVGDTVAGLIPDAVIGMMARSMPLMITGGSSAIRFTGEVAMRRTGAAVRAALVAEAQAGGFGHRRLIARINALATPWGHDDITALAAAPLDFGHEGTEVPPAHVGRHDDPALAVLAADLVGTLRDCYRGYLAQRDEGAAVARPVDR